MNDILLLPDACLSCIFKHLDCEDRVALALTCKPLLHMGTPYIQKHYVCANCGHKVFHEKNNVKHTFDYMLFSDAEGSLLPVSDVSEGKSFHQEI